MPANEPGMRFALDGDGQRISIEDVPQDISQRGTYTCPLCGAQLIARKGSVREHHFAHAPGERQCDSWASPMTAWHIGWQSAFPPEYQETVFEGTDEEGHAHRADVYLPDVETVIEFQHSPMSRDEFSRRSRFYARDGGKIAWVFDVRDKRDSFFRTGEKSAFWNHAPSWIRYSSEECMDVYSMLSDGIQVFLAVEGTDDGADGILWQVDGAYIEPGSVLEIAFSEIDAKKWISDVQSEHLPVQRGLEATYIRSDGTTEINRIPWKGTCPEPQPRELPGWASKATWKVEEDEIDSPTGCRILSDTTFTEIIHHKHAVLTLSSSDGKRTLDARLPETPLEAMNRIGYHPDGMVILDGTCLQPITGNIEVRIAGSYGDADICPDCGSGLERVPAWTFDGEEISAAIHPGDRKCRGEIGRVFIRNLCRMLDERRGQKIHLPAYRHAFIGFGAAFFSSCGHPIRWGYAVLEPDSSWTLNSVKLKRSPDGENEYALLELSDDTKSLMLAVTANNLVEDARKFFSARGIAALEYSIDLRRKERRRGLLKAEDEARSAVSAFVSPREMPPITWIWHPTITRLVCSHHLAFSLPADKSGWGKMMEERMLARGLGTSFMPSQDAIGFPRVATMEGVVVGREEVGGQVEDVEADVDIILIGGGPKDASTSLAGVSRYFREIHRAGDECARFGALLSGI